MEVRTPDFQQHGCCFMDLPTFTTMRMLKADSNHFREQFIRHFKTAQNAAHVLLKRRIADVSAFASVFSNITIKTSISLNCPNSGLEILKSCTATISKFSTKRYIWQEPMVTKSTQPLTLQIVMATCTLSRDSEVMLSRFTRE